MKTSVAITVALAAIHSTFATTIPNLYKRQVVKVNDSPIYFSANLTRVLIKDPDDNREREVSYRLNRRGIPVVNGDELYDGTEADLLAGRIRTDGKSKRAFTFISPEKHWPGAIVKYKYESTATEGQLASIVNVAISTWHNQAPWVRFQKLSANNVETPGVLLISGTQCDGCHASIGYSSSSARFMNLQTPGGSCSGGQCSATDALHEFGHIMGYRHEHQRPDRDGPVKYHCENVRPDCSNMPAGKTCCDAVPSGCCNARSNFSKIGSSTMDSTQYYDLQSVMHYDTVGFALPGTQTLTGNGQIVIPPCCKSQLSSLDVARICKIYQPLCDKSKQCKNSGCPVSCNVNLPQCPQSPACGSESPPPCCLGGVDQSCVDRKKRCTDWGCDLFK